MFEDLIKLRVTEVKVAVPAGNGVEAGLVVLEEEVAPFRTLRMFIGQPEARAIHGPWSNVVPPRPSTWDLFVSTISLLDGRIERVVITDVEELRHYFAQIVLIYQGNDDVPLLVTARPSDALALALRAYGAEIYAEPHVLDAAGLLPDGTSWVRPDPVPDEADADPAETDVDEEAVARAGLASEWGAAARAARATGSYAATFSGVTDSDAAAGSTAGAHALTTTVGKRSADRTKVKKGKKGETKEKPAKEKPTKDKAANEKAANKKAEKRLKAGD